MNLMPPDEVRSIRKSLGLTQAQAGKLIGGGPRAFAKYESGTLKPAAALVTLLRLLEANPGMLKLPGRRNRPKLTADPGPFEITHQHVEEVDAQTLPRLLERLLRAEAQANGLPLSGIHVPHNFDAPDGGEDGRISWEGDPEPEPTAYLPSRFCQFQLKSGDVKANSVKGEVLTRRKTVKPMVRSALEAGGTYTLLCTHPYTQASIQLREKRMREALKEAALDFLDHQVVFRDAHQVANWINIHASVAAWLKELTQPGTLGPFRSWTHWSGRPEHVLSSFVDDERLPPLRAFLRERVSEPRRVARIIGLAGIGKSRLVLEALGPSDDDIDRGFSARDWVLYASESEAGTEAVMKAVEVLALGGQRAIVVVDGCTPETHRILQGSVLRSESRLSLVTLDHEIPNGTLHGDSYKIETAPSSVTDTIVEFIVPGLPSEDRRRIEGFCKGFPVMATRVGTAWAENRPVADATDEDLVNAFVTGRNSRDDRQLLHSAELLATFGLVRIDPDRGNLDEVAARGRGLSADDFHAHIQDLIGRGIVQRRGQSVVLQPRPIAMKLAERQWRSWRPSRWDDVLAGDGDANLKAFAAHQLAWLNTKPIAQEVTARICRHGGPFEGVEGVSAPCNAGVLSHLAEISWEPVAEQIERSLDDAGNLSRLSVDVRRDLAFGLEKIAFRPDGFDAGARLLLRLASAGNNEYPGNSRRRFSDLFPIYLGNTAAGGAARLSFLAEVAGTNDPLQRLAVVDALRAGAETGYFSRSVGAETHGSRPAMDSWQPRTMEEVLDYIGGCVDLLAGFATCGDDAAMEARRSLGSSLRGLVGNGFIDTVEDAVRRVEPVVEPWPEALEGLNHFLIHDAESPDDDIAVRVRKLIDELTPRDLESRVRLLVTEMPWDYLDDGSEDFDARDQRQIDVVRSLAAELARSPNVLAGILPEVSRGPQRMAHTFGHALAERHGNPVTLLELIEKAALQVSEDERNFELLAGYLAGLAPSEPGAVETFKTNVAESPELAPAFPLICWRVGISPSDIDLAIQALSDGHLLPGQLERWSVGRCLKDIPPGPVGLLVDSLLSHDTEGVEVAAILMHMYARRDAARLEELRPQVRKIAEQYTHRESDKGFAQSDHHFRGLMKWILAKGRDDGDAQATALTLAKAVVASEELGSRRCLVELIPTLLEGFPEIVWPIISREIVSDNGQPWRMEYLLGGRASPGRETPPPVLSLPEEVLFAWCHAHPDKAPAFLARAVPALSSYTVKASCSSLHPLVRRLLDEFGDRDDVRRAIRTSIHSFTWVGPVAVYFSLYERPLEKLVDQHPRPEVRRWARSTLRSLAASRSASEERDDEWRARWEI